MKGPLFYFIDYVRGAGPIEIFIYSVFSVLAIILICFPVHECAHALAAKILGDDTAERQGRVTLNPFAHIDPLGAIMMFVCSIGWAKPTPVDVRRCRKVKMKSASAIIAAAGPLSNLIMSFLFMIIFKILVLVSVQNANFTIFQVAQIVYQIAAINAFLAVFNLLPIPPFDGYHILAIFLPAKAVYFFERNAQIINLILLILLASGIAGYPISWLSGKILEFFSFATSFIR